MLSKDFEALKLRKAQSGLAKRKKLYFLAGSKYSLRKDGRMIAISRDSLSAKK